MNSYTYLNYLGNWSFNKSTSYLVVTVHEQLFLTEIRVLNNFLNHFSPSKRLLVAPSYFSMKYGVNNRSKFVVVIHKWQPPFWIFGQFRWNFVFIYCRTLVLLKSYDVKLYGRVWFISACSGGRRCNEQGVILCKGEFADADVMLGNQFSKEGVNKRFYSMSGDRAGDGDRSRVHVPNKRHSI